MKTDVTRPMMEILINGGRNPEVSAEAVLWQHLPFLFSLRVR